MIGVLAVIALLAALLIPKIFESINNARIGQAVISCQTIKTATLEHYAKFQSLNSSNGVPLSVPNNNFDMVLLAERLIDKPFAASIAASSTIQLLGATAGAVNAARVGSAYDLDGDGNSDLAAGQFVVEAVLLNVSLADARALNALLDGPSLGESANGNDFAGRVVYARPGSNPLTVHIYLTHH
jgi:type II secretory pathway pseudopilin PulG